MRGGVLGATVVIVCVAFTAADITFLSFGDWGTNNTNQVAVSNAMASVARAQAPNFLISTGDNFYPAGVVSDRDEKWDKLYSEIYGSDLGFPWYSTLGNHDYIPPGLAQAQIDFDIRNRDRRWVMPDTNYTVAFDVCTGGALTGEFASATRAGARQQCHENKGVLVLVVINTVFLAPDDSNVASKNSSGLPRTPEQLEELTSAHLSWIDDVLGTANSDPDLVWLVVSGHYPIVSNGSPSNTTKSKNVAARTFPQILLPLFEKHKVDLYLSGHDHSLQAFRYPRSNLRLVVSGAGGYAEPFIREHEATVFNASANGFTLHHATSTMLTTKFIDSFERVLFEIQQERQRTPVPYPPRPSRRSGLSSNELTALLVLVLGGLAMIVIGTLVVIKVSKNVRARTERRVIKERLRMEVLVAKRQGLWQVDDEGERSKLGPEYDTDDDSALLPSQAKR